MESLKGTVETSGETVDKLQVAMGRYRDNTSSATTNTKNLIQKLKGIKLTGVWKSLADELRDTLDSVTESLKSDKLTLGISNTLTDMFDKEFKVNLKAGSLDTSELTQKDKTIQGASANVVSAKNALPDYAKKLDLVANLTSKQDSIANRVISGLTGWMTDFQNRVPENNRWFSGLTGWMTDFQNRVPENNRWFSGLTGWVTSLGDSIPISGKWFSGILGYVTALGDSIPTSGKWFSGILGYVNQVQKQSGVSLILSGITAFISSIVSGTKKSTGGAFYGGRWHDIPQFSSGGVITKDFMSSFSTIPRYAGGTVNAGSMFIAGEAGPELVGHVGGRTEVLNQSQLASVMQSAVASGMEAVMARYGGNGGGNGNVTVNVVLQGDAKKIFEVVKKENNSRVIQTGKAQLLT